MDFGVNSGLPPHESDSEELVIPHFVQTPPPDLLLSPYLLASTC